MNKSIALKAISITILAIMSLCIFTCIMGCQKDETNPHTVNTEADNRTGGSSQWKPFFYQNSMTVNSYRTLPTQPINQLSFKKNAVDTVYLEEYGNKFYLDTNLLVSFYNVKIQFKDGSAYKDQWISKYVGPIYKFKPTGPELYTYNYKLLTLNRTSVKEQYLDIEAGKLRTWYKYDIVIDTLYRQNFIKSNTNGSTYFFNHN